MAAVLIFTRPDTSDPGAAGVGSAESWLLVPGEGAEALGANVELIRKNIREIS